VPGGSTFFTVNLLERHGSDVLTRHIDELRASVYTVHRAHPLAIDARVVLPDHLHCVWTLPPADDAFSLRWRVIKAIFARSLPMSERCSGMWLTGRIRPQSLRGLYPEDWLKPVERVLSTKEVGEWMRSAGQAPL
jgi:REP element-mobilizing transposase RayT